MYMPPLICVTRKRDLLSAFFIGLEGVSGLGIDSGLCYRPNIEYLA